MDAQAETTTRWEIDGARHGGITVFNLDGSLEFYSLDPDRSISEFHERPPHARPDDVAA